MSAWRPLQPGECCLCGGGVRLTLQRMRDRLVAKAQSLDAEAASARSQETDAFSFWLGAECDATPRFSTLHMCANVWRHAAYEAAREGV